MPQRKTTEAAIETLTAADKQAAERKAEALAAIPDPVYDGSIPFEITYSDHDFNVRDAESYGFSANKTLYQSLKENGLQKRGDTMSFSVQADGRLKVLVGNLRHNMMSIIRKEAKELAERDGRELPDDQLPFARIFGLVYRHLSPSQEVALMADHIMRKSLNEFEMAKEIGELMERTSMTDARASVHFGMDKNKVRRLRMRYSMPTVLAEYRKEKSKDKDVAFVKVGNEQLDALYTAYLSDRDAGCDHREEGVNFKRAWAIVLSNPDAFKRASQDKPPESLEPKKITDQAASLGTNFGNTPEMECLARGLRWASGDDEVRLDEAASDLKAYCDALRTENESLRSAVETLTVERNAWIDRYNLIHADYDGVITERDEFERSYNGLRTEHAELRAEYDRLATAKSTTTNGRRKASK
jgi:hypothetical protein